MQLLILRLLFHIMNKTTKNLLVTGAALASSVAMPFAVSAQTTTTVNKLHDMFGGRGQHGTFVKPATTGTVTAINGTSISITTKDNKAITVDASAPGVASIKVGDLIMVEGTLNGTNAVATKINDIGTIPAGARPFEGRKGPMGMGMRRPGAMGTVTAINGTSLTLTGPMNEIITVDASAADISTLKVGDKIAVEGSVKTIAVTATAIHAAGDFKPHAQTKQPQPSTAQ